MRRKRQSRPSHIASDGTLRVLTWNIHKGIGGLDRRYDLDRVLRVLQHYSPDIAMLQEVAESMPRLRWDDQPDILQNELQMHGAFHPEHQFRRGGYGNLILSRWPLSQINHVDLTIGFRKTRGVLQARARVRIDRKIRSLVLHNMHLGLAGSERARQLQRFLDCQPFDRLHERTPLVVAGDLNDLWGTLGPKFLNPRGLERAGSLSNTFPAALPLRPLDGIFFRGDLAVHRCHIPRAEIARQASDHLPIVADMQLHGL